jgi:hypothetical protein
VSFEENDPALAAEDFAVGSVLLMCGVAAWDRRPESRVGALMSLAGLTWFLGTAFEPALYLHRGPLAHLFLSYPNGRLSTPALTGRCRGCVRRCCDRAARQQRRAHPRTERGPYVSSRRDRRFCTDRCRLRAWREQRRNRAAASAR